MTFLLHLIQLHSQVLLLQGKNKVHKEVVRAGAAKRITVCGASVVNLPVGSTQSSGPYFITRKFVDDDGNDAGEVFHLLSFFTFDSDLSSPPATVSLRA